MKNKPSFFTSVFLILAFTLQLRATSMDVSGTISSNTTWSGVDTVNVVGSVTISNGVTLSIDPGIIVLFQGHYKIDVKGRLLAIGTVADTILFTSADTSGYHNYTHTGWGGIELYNTDSSNDTTKIVYCKLEFGKDVNSQRGGAILIAGFDKLLVDHSELSNNYASLKGGAIFIWNNAAAVISNCHIHDNYTVYDGGGVFSWDALSLTNSTISNNEAGNNGGGINVLQGVFTFTNNLVSNNSAGSSGGGISISNSYNSHIINNTIVNNTASNGAGVYTQNRPPDFRNTIIYGNTPSSARQVYLGSDFYTTAFYYCDIEEGAFGIHNFQMVSTYENCIDADPGFMNTDSHPFSLQQISPCINTGDTATTTADVGMFDLAGNARIYDGFVDRIDMGAYEYQGDPKPVLVSLLPANHAEIINTDPPLEIQFSLEITAQTGYITIYNGDHSVFEQIAANNTSLVTVDSLSAFIDPVQDFIAGNSYYVLIDSLAFAHQNGEFFAGIYEDTTWNISLGEIDDFAGNALDFDGDNDYVQIADNASLDFTENYTIEAWIRPGSFGWLSGIVSKYQTAGADGYYLRLNPDSPHTGISFDGMTTPNGILSANEWYHVVGVNENGTRSVYVNGEQQILSGTADNIQANTDPLRIGVDYSNRNFNGKIDEVRIWNIALSETQIREHIYSPLTGNEAGLVSYFQMNEQAGTSTRDLISGFVGNLENMTNDDRIASTLPFGTGENNAQIVDATGSVVFGNTAVTMDFTAKSGTDTVQVYRIDTLPNIFPSAVDTSFGSQYWVVNKYGNGTFAANLSFTIAEDLTMEDENHPGYISLYSRSSGSDSDWTRLKLAASVDAASNTATFNGIGGFSQFMLARFVDTIPPQTQSLSPANGVFVDADVNLEIAFTKTVYEVSGKTIKIYRTDDNSLFEEFVLPSPRVTGTGTNTITIDPTDDFAKGSHYHVIIDSAAFEDFAGNPFAEILDPADWNFSIIAYGNISENTIWSGHIAVTQSVFIEDGITLTIKPGAYIEFYSNYTIDVQGRLLAIGTEDEQITFTAKNHSDEWDRLKFISTPSSNDTSKIIHCLIEYSKACCPDGFYKTGGAIIISDFNKLLVSFSTFRYNSAYYDGGAIYCGNANISIKNSIFYDNIAASGGAIYSSGSSFTLVNSLLHDNAVTTHGGGIWIEGGNPVLLNNTIYKNKTSYEKGGGIYIQSSSPLFKNNILYKNTHEQSNTLNQIYLDDDGCDPDFYNCDIEGGKEAFDGNGAGANYSGTYEHNIDSDPAFIGSGDYPYSIDIKSPCANAGDPSTTIAEVGEVDLANNPRFTLGSIDIGAYESTATFDHFPGTALRFDGNSHYVNIPNQHAIDLTDNFTIEAWIRPASFSWLAGIVSKYHSPGADGYTLRLTSASPYSGIEFNGQSTSAGVLEEDQWYYIVAVRQSGTNHVYINGVEQVLTGSGSPVTHNTDPLCIGVDYLSSPRYFDGLIDEVKVWNFPLTVTEIRKNMNLALTGTAPGLAAYWEFNNGSGTQAIDRAGPNDATLNNMDNNDWLQSTISFGSGNSNNQMVSFTGSLDFTGTGVSMNFTEKSGTDTIVVSRIDTLPDVNPQNCDTSFSSQYWVIGKYGQGQFTADASFTLQENLTADDESNPSLISLYKRKINGGSEWLRWKVAISVNAATNTATFNGLDEFGQFLIGREIDTIPPAIASTYPESWGILASLHKLDLNFDESVDEVSGKSIVIYQAGSNIPARTFTLPSSAVSGSGSETISIALDPALPPGDYYVTVEPETFTDASLNGFAGITDAETWKITILEAGVIENSVWSGNLAVYTDITTYGNLTIDPGANVKMMGHYAFEIWGGFYAEGNENDSIHFFANDTAAGWKGLRFNGWGKISYCRFEDGNAVAGNNDEGFGGVIYLAQGTNPTIEHSFFYHNRAEGQGGAIYCYASDPVISNNIFRNNTCDYGGAISVDLRSNPKIENNLFVNNSAPGGSTGDGYGGAILFTGQSSPDVYNNTFSQNHAAYGGAVSCIMGSNPVFTNCIFYGNQTTEGGNEINVSFPGHDPTEPDFYYCLVGGGKEAIEGNYTGTYENNIDADPIFIETGDKPFGLLKSSPCVNTGDPTTTTADVGDTDLAGGPRFLHGQIDMGAYETSMTPDGFAGTALRFDGSDDYVRVSDNSSLDIANSLTIEAWIKADSWETNIWEGTIVGKDKPDETAYNLRCGDNGRLSFVNGISSSWQEVQSSAIMQLDTWNHICGTYDGISQKIYINGELVGEHFVAGQIGTNNLDLFIGTSPGYSGRFFDGKIDEVRIWNVERTKQQIRENMYLTIPENETGLVSYWQFNTASGNVVADLIGENRGKLHNMTNDDWVNSTIPFGDGNSNTQIVSTTGNKLFPNTGIEMDFQLKSGTDTLTVSRIDTLPNMLPAGGEIPLDNSYWVMNSFGEGTYNTQLIITPEKELTVNDELNPSNFLLFNRENTSDLSWSFVQRAASVDAQNNSIIFDSITNSGQFELTKNEFDYYPGYALKFDTSAGYLTLANESHFDFDTAFTLETWIWLDSVSTDYHSILSKGNAWMLRLVYADDAIMLEFSINKGDQQVAVTFLTDTATMLKKWNHITCVYHNEPPDNFINIYLNGIEGNSTIAEFLIPNDEPVRIGSSFKGKLDELRFWRSRRSTKQIRESMHLTLDYPFEGLVSNFQLNEGEGNTVKDPFMGNHGSLTNFTPPAGWVRSDVPFGGGHSNTQIEQSGTVIFNGTGVSMDFNWPPGASITVSKIDTAPNINPNGLADVFDSRYWVIERYGDGSFNADLTFSPDENLDMNDLNNPGEIKLFHRPPNANTDWVLIDSANQVDLITNEVHFDEISQTGQFIIGRKKPFSGYPGTALYFNGENDYVSGNGIDTSLSAFTIEAWINHDTLPAVVQRYITLEPEVAVLRYDGTIYGGYGELHFYIKKPSGHFYGIRVDSVLTSGKWLHVTGTYDGTNMKLYLNGKLLSAKIPAAGLYTPNGDFTFGGNNESMHGEMDEIRIWDFARTESQIRESMHRVINMSEEGLTYYWQFNEGSGSMANDTVTGLVGSLQNMDIANCWKTSTIPAGMGVSNTQWISTTGPVSFSPTDLKMDFSAIAGNDSVVVTKINIAPNINPLGDYTVFDSQYWVVNNFGENNFSASLTFKVNDTLGMEDEYAPSRIKLFGRASNSDSSWVVIAGASLADVATRQITFDGIQHFSQFIIARNTSDNHSPGNCLHFDGVDDYVLVPADTNLATPDFTVEFWVRTSEPGVFSGIIDKGRSTKNNWYFLSGDEAYPRGITFGIYCYGYRGEIIFSWVDNNWHHVAGVYNGITMTLYVDGNYHQSTNPGQMITTRTEITIGGRANETAFFKGNIDEVRIWDYARSQAEIREDMHHTINENKNGLVAYWPLDESAGITAHDISGGNNGTLHDMTAAAWEVSTAPVPYFSISDGDWENNSIWALGQQMPNHSWARARINNQISLNSNAQLMELFIRSDGVLTVMTGFTLIIQK